MAYEKVFRFMVWDHQNDRWWMFSPAKGADRTMWDTEGKARTSLSAKFRKNGWQDRFSIIKCEVVPVEDSVIMAQFKQL